MKDGSFSKAIRFGNIVKIPPRISILVNIDGNQLGQILVDDVDKCGIN